MANQKTIIISNRLPVSIKKEDGVLNYQPSAGGLATGLGTIYKSGDNIWLGWPGLFSSSPEEQNSISTELAKESMRPVFLTEEDVQLYYEGFSNSTIWPLFHYFTQYAEYLDQHWESYKSVNQKFCDAVLEYANDGDIIWVHDYQLMLLPEMIRKKLPNASIGYFHHIPFPSYEIFRLLPWRKEVLSGLLGADMIGYHTYDDMRHFLSAVSRIIGEDHELGHLKHDDRIVTVDALPMGIDYDKYANAALSEETQKEIKSFSGSVTTEQLMLSIDRLDYSKGIPERIVAFDKFLEAYPEFQGKVSLILLVVPSRDNVEHYVHLKEELDLLVGRINGKYGMLAWTPVFYFYRALPFHKLSALYSMADVALVTPLRDGMNLVCKEYIASRLDQTGVLILSEMAGSAKELSEALIVNPNDQNSMVEAMHQALTMNKDEQISRNTAMQSKLKRYNINRWVEVFMDRLDYTKKSQKELQEKHLNAKSKAIVLKEYREADKRLILLDYDGTLQPFTAKPENAFPDEELLTIFEKLTSDPKNHVVVISGRDRHALQKWLGGFHTEFVAEHGVWCKEHGHDWEMTDTINQSWKEEIVPILELYVDRTPGSLIEHKDYSVVWHFRKAEAGLGDLRARELISNLQYLTSNMDIHIMEGNKVIEIKAAGINKGRAASKWLNKDDYGFIFAIGDDSTDEDTFKAMPPSAHTIKVGHGVSAARYNIKSVARVRELLSEFAGIQKEVEA